MLLEAAISDLIWERRVNFGTIRVRHSESWEDISKRLIASKALSILTLKYQPIIEI